MCSASTTAPCEPGARKSGESAQEAHPRSVGPAWVAESGLPGTVLPLPVSLSEVTTASESPMTATAPSSPPPERAEREAVPPREPHCARGARSFVEVLESLM